MTSATPVLKSRADPSTAADLRIRDLENRLQGERLARLDAEATAERRLNELYEKQRQLELLEQVATKSNQNISVEEVLQFIVEAVCKHVGCLMGNVYVLDLEHGPRLVPSGFMHLADPDGLDEFLKATESTIFLPGKGLPGRVLVSGKAAWICDVTGDPNFLRAASAKLCGIHGAFAFPVLVGDDVLAVVEFFFRPVLQVDEALLYVMNQIGTQLGRVMERKRAQTKLVYDATHDHLTGLPNRQLFLGRLEQALVKKKRHPDTQFAVIFIDLDRFKLVNDSLGHAAGDSLLQEIARRMSVLLEAFGTGGDGDAPIVPPVLARLGGDEFTVLLDDIPSPSFALKIAEHLHVALQRPVTVGVQELVSTASFGVALGDTRYASAADLMRDADLAMYRAKTDGRSRVEMFDRSLHETATQRLAMEGDLRKAMNAEEFFLQYQPIIDLGSGAVEGFEALVRWRMRDGQVVPPMQFIGVAEDTGLIVPLGIWIMRQAFSTLARWHEASAGAKSLTMSVNVSPRQFHQPNFVAQVAASLAESGVDPHRIKLELTESVMIRDAERTAAVLTELRQLGLRVSIDDFGTGYSSLSYLHRLPFDTLKIDRSFVSAINERSEGRQLVRTIIDMAKNLNMEVIAEGVETQIHARLLTAIGCNFGQGYYFHRPLDLADAGRLVSSGPA